MSLELHAFMNVERLPTRAEWQTAISDLGFPLELDPELDLASQSGFSPCTLSGRATGCEIYLDSPEDILPSGSAVRERTGGMERVVSFRWGGDMAECACAVAAAAVLVERFGAVAYDPQEDVVNDFKQLRSEFKQCAAELGEAD